MRKVASGACIVASTVALVLSFWGLAGIAQRVLDASAGRGFTGADAGRALADSGGWIALFIGAGVLAQGFRSLSGYLDAAERRHQTAVLRRAITEAAFSERPVAMTPSQASDAAMEFADSIATYNASYTPLRYAAPVRMLLIAVAVGLAHWPLLAVLAIAVAIVPVNMWLAGVLAQDTNNKYLSAFERLSTYVLDSYRGMDTLVRFHGVRRREKRLEEASDALRQAQINVLTKAFLSTAVMDLIITLSIAVCAIYIGFSLLGYIRVPGAALTLQTGLFVLLLAPEFFRPAQEMAAGFHSSDEAEKATAAIVELLGLDPLHGDATAPDDDAAPRRSPLRAVAPMDAAVEVRGPEGFDAPAGRWTVITGPSGSGKTTLLRKLAGYTPSPEVSWDGAPPTMGAAAWIGQDTVIFPASVADNVRLGAPEASADAVRRALNVADLKDVVDALPQGADTVIGNGGYQLSAGERRRVAIARAVVRGAKLWMLDEPTAHLDEESEERVLRALENATRAHTVVMVSHSPRAVELADRVVEVKAR